MLKIITALFSAILITGCATPQKAPRDENLFPIMGQTLEVSDEQLAIYRSRWVTSPNIVIEASPYLTKSDIQWSLDLISIYESLQNQDCQAFKLLQTRDFAPAVDTDKHFPNLIPDKFDYVWEIDVCGKQRNYRVVNPKGSSNFSVHLLVQ
ncbi:MAG: hypothetical protein QNJ78_10375 [Gammaproteobacteria bacterium]|nr:hypothetical protein [Gammaproteobacteria bacterium]